MSPVHRGRATSMYEARHTNDAVDGAERCDETRPLFMKASQPPPRCDRCSFPIPGHTPAAKPEPTSFIYRTLFYLDSLDGGAAAADQQADQMRRALDHVASHLESIPEITKHKKRGWAGGHQNQHLADIFIDARSSSAIRKKDERAKLGDTTPPSPRLADHGRSRLPNHLRNGLPNRTSTHLPQKTKTLHDLLSVCTTISPGT